MLEALGAVAYVIVKSRYKKAGPDEALAIHGKGKILAHPNRTVSGPGPRYRSDVTNDLFAPLKKRGMSHSVRRSLRHLTHAEGRAADHW